MIFIFLSVGNALLAGGRSVCVSTQAGFDAAVESINKGEPMSITLRRGQYSLKQSIVAKAPLSLKGCGAVITGADRYTSWERIDITGSHYVYRLKQAPTLFPLFFSEDYKILPVSESVLDDERVNYVKGEIKAEDAYVAGTSIRIPIPSNLKHLKNKTFARAYGYLDSGWKVVPFEVMRSDKSYFYCITRDECPTKNYEYDREFYKKQIRFVLFNAELKPGAVYYDNELLYVPKELPILYVLNCKEKGSSVPSITAESDIVLKNIRFAGFGGVKVNSGRKAKCEIIDCRFDNTLGCALQIEKNNGFGVRMANVKGCAFNDCSVYNENIVILKSNFDFQPCIRVSGCSLTRHSGGEVMYKNASGALWVDADVTIENNVVYNTCRCHLYFNRGEIVARGNILYNTDAFNARTDRNLSCDWGIIYCNHIFYGGNNTERALDNAHHHILLENNLRYGAVSYGGDARGIYIDNGRGDVECRGNVVLNVKGYSLDTYNSPLTNASAVRNRYSGNIVTSKYRLLSGSAVEGANVPVTRENLLLGDEQNKTSNIRVDKEDVRLEDLDASSSCTGGRIRVSYGLYNVLKKSSAWREINRYVER